MIDIILVVIICLLLALIAWDRHESKLERAKLMNMIISRNATELRDLEAVDKISVKANLPMQPPDLIPSEQLTDKQFDDQIKEAIQNGQ